MALEVKIRKRLGDFQLDVAFAGEKETLGLLGASGCGKSMTLKCIAGIEVPDEGSIVLDGCILFDSAKRVNLPPQKRRVGYLFQQYALFPNMTVWQNIGCGVRERSKAQEAICEYIRLMHLEGLEGLYPWQLSGGQQQRVALARILVNEPDVLLLDEPFSALDGYLRWKMELEMMELLKGFARTTLFVSHSRDEIYRICDRVCVMNHGATEPTIPIQTLFERPGTVSAALLSGCKNYTAIRPGEGNMVEAVDWGVPLHIAGGQPVGELVGVRAHYVKPARGGETENVFSCRVLRIVQDVFSIIVMVKPLDALPTDYGTIRMELEKGEGAGLREGETLDVHIRPEDIMQLTREA